MTQNDWKPFTELIGRVYRLYQRPPLEIDDMRLYFDTLADLPFAAVAEGVKRHMKACTGVSGRFAPLPADIILALFGTPEQQAAKAWTHVRMAMGKIGLYNSVRFDDPKIHFALAACGGWSGLGWATIDKEPCFRRAYLAAITNEVSWDDVPHHMAGENELDGGWNWRSDQIVDVKTLEYGELDGNRLLSAAEQKQKRLTA